jgi:putative Holliday junction resolvase
MRVLGIDYGQRRIGLAVSDASAMLARPWKTVTAGASPALSADLIAGMVTQADDELADVQAIVVGIPRRLNGEDTGQTRPAREFAARLRAALPALSVTEQDERLSSHEADQLLARNERDWRRRKAKLDAAAAAVILQDYLDQSSSLRKDDLT